MIRIIGFMMLVCGMLSGGIWLMQSRLAVDVTQFEELARIGVGDVTDVAISPDSQTAALTTTTGVYLVDLATLTAHEDHMIHDGWSDRAAWSPDGSMLAFSSAGNLFVWDAETGDKTLLHKSPDSSSTNIYSISQITWSPDGSQLNAVEVNHLRDLSFTWTVDETNSEDRTWSRQPGTEELSWSPDGRYTLSLTPSGVVEVRDAQTGEEVYRGPTGNNLRAVFSPDGSRLAWWGAADKLRIVDTQTWETVLHLPSSVNDFMSAAVWSPDGDQLAVWVNNSTLQIWDAESGAVERTLYTRRPGENPLTQLVAWSPDGSMVLAYVNSHKLMVWDTNSWQPTAERYTRLNKFLNHIAIAPDGEFAVVSSNNSSLQVWRFDQDVPLWTVETAEYVYGLAVSPDGSQILTLLDGDLYLWNAETGQRVTKVMDRFPGLNSVTWSDQGIAVYGWNELIVLRDAAVGSETSTLTLAIPEAANRFLSWSPTSAHIAITSTSGFEMWDTGRGVSLWIEANRDVSSPPAWSSDGRYVLTRSQNDHDLVLWDAETGESHILPSVHRSQGRGTPHILGNAWSPDGVYLATGFDNGKIIVQLIFDGRWFNNRSLVDLYLQPALSSNERGDPSAIRVQWTSDGRRLISVNSDGTLRIWGIPGEEDG